MTQDRTISTLMPEGRKVTAQGEDFTILPFRVKHLKAVLKHFQGLSISSIGADFDIAGILNGPGQDGVFEAIALATGKDRAWVDELYPHEALGLAKAVFEVNIDFFAQHGEQVMGVVQNGLAAQVEDAPLSGEKSLTSSSALDTASPTS